MDFEKIITSIIRILLGFIFISSSILKLFSLDNFILYVYSLGFFSYVATTFLARLLIIAEFLLGIGLIFKIFYKTTWWSSLILLSAFTILLTYIAIFRDDDNCHCFGDLIDINANWSIIKNILLIVFLFIVKKQEEWRHTIKIYITTISIAAIIFVTFFGFPPNSIYMLFFGDDEERFIQEAYDTHIPEEEYAGIVDSSKNCIIGLVSATCKHCKIGNRIMGAIFKQNNLDSTTFRNLVWAKTDSLLTVFKDTTKTQEFLYIKMPPTKLIEINNGHFPTYIFVEKGHVTKSFNYKEINEKEIVDFIRYQ